MVVSSDNTATNVKIGNIEVNLINGMIKHKTFPYKFDRFDKVGKRDVRALKLLLDNENDVVSKLMLMELVWGKQIVTENSLAVVIFNLRKLLNKYDEHNNYTLINVSGYGYGLYNNQPTSR